VLEPAQSRDRTPRDGETADGMRPEARGEYSTGGRGGQRRGLPPSDRRREAVRGRAALGLVTGLLAIASCSGKAAKTNAGAEQTAVELQQQAREAMARGDAATARDRLARAVALVPNDASAWNALGLAQEALGDADGAQASFEHAILAAPSEHEAHLNLAVLLMHRGVSGRARTEFEQAVQFGPRHALPYWNFAAALVDVGKPEQARELLDRALELEPACGPAHAEFGRVESKAGHADAALQHFAAAETLGVATPTFFGNYGLELLQAGRTGEAETRLARATALDSTRAPLWNHLGVARLRGAHPAEAIAPFERAHALAPADQDIRYNLASALFRLERYADAVKLLADPRPARADLLALWGMSLRGAGRTREAVPLLHEASEKAARDVGILNNYGVILAETGDVPAAVAVWRRVLDIEPANKTAHDNLAARGAH
jgi:Flp pilus assembly protein TadD